MTLFFNTHLMFQICSHESPTADAELLWFACPAAVLVHSDDVEDGFKGGVVEHLAHVFYAA